MNSSLLGKYDYARHGPLLYAVESSNSSSRPNKSSTVNIKSKSSTGNTSTSNNTSDDNMNKQVKAQDYKKKLSGMRIQQLYDMYHPSRHSIPKNLKKKYTSAYIINDFPRCSALLKTAKKIQRNEIRYTKQKHYKNNRCLDNLEAQSWGPDFVKISDMCDRVGAAADFSHVNIAAMCDQVSTAAAQGSACFQNINEMLSSVKSYFTNDNDLWKKFAAFVTATTLFYKSERDITSVIAYLINIASQFSISANIIQRIFASWKDKCADMILGLFAQSDEDQEELGFFGAVVETICTIIGWTPDMTNFLQKSSLIGRGLTGMEKINKLLLFSFSWIRDCFFRNAYGCSYEEHKERKEFPLLSDFIQACEIINEVKDEFISSSSEVCKLIQDTNKLGIKLLNESRKESSLRSYINILLHRILPTVEKAKHSPAVAKTNRSVPYALYIYGPAGVGKTSLMQILMCHMFRRYIKNYVPGFEKCYHSRKAENDYFDGYMRQPFLLYDDIFQRQDLPTVPNPEVMEIIRAINDDPYQLHMASIEDKKTTYMDSEFVIATSNQRIPTIRSITCSDAVFRRFGTAIKVGVKRDFGIPVESSTPEGRYYKVDPTKVESLLDTQFYTITEYSLLTGQSGREYTFDEFKDELFSRIDTHRGRHSTRRNLLRQLAGEEVIDVDESACLKYQQKLHSVLSGLSAQADENVGKEESTSEEDQGHPRDYEQESAKIFEDVFTRQTDSKVCSLSDKLLKALQHFKEQTSMVISEDFVPTLTSFKEEFEELAKKTRAKAEKIIAVFKEKIQVVVDKVLEYKFALLFPLLGFCTYFLYKYHKCPLLSLDKPVNIYNMQFCSCERCTYVETLVKASTGRDRPENRHSESIQILGMLLHQYSDKDLFKVISPLLIFRGSDNARVYKHIKSDNFKRKMSESADIANKLNLNSEHQASGDYKTRTVAKSLMAEYQASGDFKTRTVAKALIAEASSGDPETRKIVRDILAEISSDGLDKFDREMAFQSMETDNLTNAANSIRIEDKIVAQSGDLNCVEQFQSTIARNAVILKRADGALQIGAVFVTGRVVLVPFHFYTQAIEGQDTFLLFNPFQQNLKTPIDVEECFFHRFVDMKGEHVDALLIALPFSVPSRPNIVEKFSRASDFSKTGEGEVVLAGLNVMRGVPIVKQTTAVKSSVWTQPLEYPDKSGARHRINKSVLYNATTAPGDCGSLLFARNTLISGKILGIHVAGDSKQGYGVSLAISKEGLSRNLQEFARKVNDPRKFVLGNFAAQMAIIDPALAYSKLGELGDYLPIGELEKKVGRPTKTVLRESLIHGDIYETLTKPAYLAPQRRDGELIDPLKLGMQKVCGEQTLVDRDILKIAVHDTKKQYEHTPEDLQRVLTYTEALKGVEGREYAAPINRSTSPGYPYNVDNPEGGKHKWLGRDENWVLDNPVLKADVESIIDKAKNNQRSDIVFTATLKDERRPIQKVEELKTRVFEAAPLAYVVAVRMYFLGFVEHVMRNRIKNEVCVGTNHLSLDWHFIGEKLQSKGNKVIAGDFSNYDGSLHQGILWMVNDVINDWYDGANEETQIRNILFEEICNTIVSVDGVLIQQTHSQPSGNPLTVIINSIYNQLVMRYGYLICKRSAGLPVFCDFTKEVALAVYGDDNTANISDNVCEWYNQTTITVALATIGLKYTDEAKTGDVLPYRSLSEVNFLKRKFVKDQWGYWCAPILIHVPRDQSNWIRGNESRAATLENCSTALLEFALHGPDVYNMESKLLRNACAAKGLTLNVPHHLEWVSFFGHHRGINNKK